MSTTAPRTPASIGRSGEKRMSNGPAARTPDRRESGIHRQSTLGRGERLARGLGWLSLGLGLAQVAAPRAVARLLGLRESPRNCRTIRAIGAREITAGLGILSRPRPAGWLWTRVGFDVADLALLASALGAKRTERNRVVAATAATAGFALLDTLAGLQLRRSADTRAPGAQGERAAQVIRAITVACSPEDAHRFWRDLTNLPRFMTYLDSVQLINERQSRWSLKAPAGPAMELDAEILDDRPGELISWRALAGMKVVTSGSVRFRRAPGGRGTEVRVEIDQAPPGGLIGAGVARLVGGAIGLQAEPDLRRFKQLMEIGEVVQSDASVHWGPHPAQPPGGRREPEPSRQSAFSSTEGAVR
ncbi:SRPBCC family protein [Sorangium sp. So ce136]|uniref:SRPBCC family protein n=1 Tax=Sorangium sp. So ce136 TaxID=3133284 RepID=UPI003F05E81E